MTNKKQYFRDIKPGDVSVEGRQSNGFTADIKGNVIFYSGLKDTELDYLSQTQYNGNIPFYYGNSYFGVIKSETHNTLLLGNNNYETLNQKVTEPNKITTTLPKDTIYDPCKDKNVLIVGDSISFDAGYTWSSLYKKNQTDKNVKILAIGGKQLTVWMKPELEKELKTNKYDTVFIYGGVNDSWSGKTAERILTALQSMVDTVKAAGAQSIIVTGYDAELDMDIKKIKYDDNTIDIPSITQYKKFQSLVASTIKGALIIPKVSIGVLSDGFHPSAKQAKTLYEHILKNIPKCGEGNKTTPTTQPQTEPPPTKEPPPPPPAPPIVEEEEDFLFLDDIEFELDPTQLTDIEGPRHVFSYTKQYQDALNETEIKEQPKPEKNDPPPATPNTPYNTNKLNELVLMYLGHNQGDGGLRAILYYSLKDPKSKTPTPNKFTKQNINGHMYGYRLNGTKYVTIKYSKTSTNVGDDFIKKYGNNPDTDFTPGNFLSYWIEKVPSILGTAKNKIKSKPNLLTLFTSLSSKYGVPLDYIIVTAYIESTFDPKAENTDYKGLFQLSRSEFDKYYPGEDIFDVNKNSDVGVQLLAKKIIQAKKLLNEYSAYIK